MQENCEYNFCRELKGTYIGHTVSALFACQTAYFKYLFLSYLNISLNQFILWIRIKVLVLYSSSKQTALLGVFSHSKTVNDSVILCLPLEPEKCWPSFVLIGLFREDGDIYSILVLSMFESKFRTLSWSLLILFQSHSQLRVT